MSFWYIEDNNNYYSARNNTASGKKESFDQREIRTERAEGGVTGKSASTKQVAGIQGYPNDIRDNEHRRREYSAN